MKEWNIEQQERIAKIILFLVIIIIVLLGVLGFTISELISLRNEYLSLIEKCSDCLEYQ